MKIAGHRKGPANLVFIGAAAHAYVSCDKNDPINNNWNYLGDKMLFRNFIICLITLCFLSGCDNQSCLFDDIYTHIKNVNYEDSLTASIILSNMFLTEKNIEKIKNDYQHENDPKRKYLFEFILAKRTQENKFINGFIKNSKNNTSLLLENKSLWASINSPFYEQLSYYSRFNDEALGIIIKLVNLSDGSNLTIIADDLHEIYTTDKIRFRKITEKLGIKEKDILKYFEEE